LCLININNCLAWDLGTEVVGADTHIAGVGDSGWGVGNSVAEGGVGGSNSSVGMGVGVGSIGGVAKAIVVGVSIGRVEEGWVSLSLSIGGSLAIVSVVSIRISVVGVWSTSAGNGDVGSVHTGSALATESIGSIGVWKVVSSIESVGISLGVDSSNKSNRSPMTNNNKMRILSIWN